MNAALVLMRRSLPHALVSLVAAPSLLLATTPLTSRAMLVYSAEGSSISGSLGGVTFTDASWRLQATADETLSTLTSFTTGPGTFNFWWLPVSPRLTITTAGTILTADLQPETPFRWIALSGTFPVGFTPKIGFVYTTPSFNPETAAGVFGVVGSFVNLKSPVNFAGSSIFELNSYPTSSGTLLVNANSTVPGVFRIDPVPGPLPALVLAGAVSWSRRFRRRIGQKEG